MIMADRDCENCIHYVRKVKEPYKSIGDAFRGCEKWNCEFEPKERANENAKETTDGKSETGDMCNASL